MLIGILLSCCNDGVNDGYLLLGLILDCNDGLLSGTEVGYNDDVNNGYLLLLLPGLLLGCYNDALLIG